MACHGLIYTVLLTAEGEQGNAGASTCSGQAGKKLDIRLRLAMVNC